MFKWVKTFVSRQLMTSSLALGVAPTLSKWMMGAVITWPVLSVAVNSAGSAWRRSPTCTTSGTRVIPPCQQNVCRFSHTCSHDSPSFPTNSPSGCTFWGKKPWSRKKKILWQLGTLIGAPVGITLIAGIAVPAMVIGIPVYIGRKVRKSTKEMTFKLWFTTVKHLSLSLWTYKCIIFEFVALILFQKTSLVSVMINFLPTQVINALKKDIGQAEMLRYWNTFYSSLPFFYWFTFTILTAHYKALYLKKKQKKKTAHNLHHHGNVLWFVHLHPLVECRGIVIWGVGTGWWRGVLKRFSVIGQLLVNRQPVTQGFLKQINLICELNMSWLSVTDRRSLYLFFKLT